MRMPVEFEIPGVPVAKGRPRFARIKGFVRTFTPQTSARFEDRVRLCAINAGVKPLAGAVGLDIRAYWPSKGPARKKEPRPESWKATRPDIDNVVKSICDGLQGVAMLDDAQVVSVTAQKLHAAQGSPPRVVVRVIPLGGS